VHAAVGVDKAIVNSGTNMVNWLRGVQDYADDNLFRAYSTTTDAAGATVPIVIGDIASSKPAYVREPHNNYPDTAYTDYKTAKANRPGTVFVAANDGMLHAFDGATGNERWAYVPRIVMSKTGGAGQHHLRHQPPVHRRRFAGSGGRQDQRRLAHHAGRRPECRRPRLLRAGCVRSTAPKVMWEICADAAVCPQNRVR
jgi:type IV pilus assembly protein PilY1